MRLHGVPSGGARPVHRRQERGEPEKYNTIIFVPPRSPFRKITVSTRALAAVGIAAGFVLVAAVAFGWAYLASARRDRQYRIELVGSTGRSTGPHLHYEVRRGEKAVNPREFILDASQ